MHLDFDVWNYVNVVAHREYTNVCYVSSKFYNFSVESKVAYL